MQPPATLSDGVVVLRELREDDRAVVLSTMRVIATRRHRDNYEIAYLAAAAGRGRGLMTRAVRILCDWLLENGVGRLELRTHPGNEASQRLAHRAGFRREGLERKSIWLHDERADAFVWSLLPGDPR
jgi:RimJ/RimL family protein N-acetyltransferase